MPVKFVTKKIPIHGAKLNFSADGSVRFRSKVISAGVAVSGFVLNYDHSDHHFGIARVQAFKDAIIGNNVLFHVACLLSDKNLDDSYSGEIRVLVIAEVEAVGIVTQKRTRLTNPKRKRLTGKKSSTYGRSRSHRVARQRRSR